MTNHGMGATHGEDWIRAVQRGAPLMLEKTYSIEIKAWDPTDDQIYTNIMKSVQ
jgi:hypothetical protein